MLFVIFNGIAILEMVAECRVALSLRGFVREAMSAKERSFPVGLALTSSRVVPRRLLGIPHSREGWIEGYS